MDTMQLHKEHTECDGSHQHCDQDNCHGCGSKLLEVVRWIPGEQEPETVGVICPQNWAKVERIL